MVAISRFTVFCYLASNQSVIYYRNPMKNSLSYTIHTLICLLMCSLSTGLFAQEFHRGVTAHRGNSSEFPENTISAFKSAIAMRVDWVELDVFLTKDQKLVVLHDASTKRVGNLVKDIASTNYADLKSIDIATDFRKRTGKTINEVPKQSIPLLEEVLTLFTAANSPKISIQPKVNCVKQAVELVKRMNLTHKVGFNDGNLDYMIAVKKLEPSLHVFWDRPANHNLEDDIKIAKEYGFESMVINEKGMTEEKVNLLKMAEIEPGAWTVNDRDQLIKFLQMGVSRIYTDVPALLIELKKTYKVVVCEGGYASHLQGIDTDNKSAIFWSWTTEVVRTDMEGKIEARVAALNHQGDLCYQDGKLYVAVNLGQFNQPAGKAKSWIYEYDAVTLKELNQYPVPELVHGAGGIAYHNGSFMVVGGLVPGIDENYLYEYDKNFKFIKRHTIASGYTLMGVQTIMHHLNNWWLGCYGKPPVLIRTNAQNQYQSTATFDASLGIAPYSSTHMWIGSNISIKGKGHVGRLTLTPISAMTN